MIKEYFYHLLYLLSGVNRPYGNHKGIFTRQRQPKPAAFTIRNRYISLGTQH